MGSPVRQIEPLYILHPGVSWRFTDLRYLFSLPDAVGVDERKDTKTDTPTGGNHYFGRDLALSIARARSLWAFGIKVWKRGGRSTGIWSRV
jgi:hypothetical protein